MRRMLFYALGLLVVVLVVAFLTVGAFPPSSHPVAVDRVLPNTQFK